MLNYLKRRFSSGDIQGEFKDEREREAQILELNSNIRMTGLQLNKESPASPADNPPNSEKVTSNNQKDPRPINVPKKQPSPSAPTSPTKTMTLSTMMNAAKDILNTNTNNWTNNTTPQNPQQNSQNKNSFNRQNTIQKEKYKVLLIIDHKSIEWNRFFRNKKIYDYELRIEQVHS